MALMNKVKEWRGLEPGRITSLVSDLSDKLKSDYHKVYERTLNDGRP